MSSTLFLLRYSEQSINTEKSKDMRKIKVYIAASIDGYIARLDGGLDWLTEFPNPQKDDYGYSKMLSSVDAVIMGGRTLHELSCMDILWPYKDKLTYIVSRKAIETNANVEFITEGIIEKISELRSKNGKDIWLAGGGELITMLLNAELVDEMQICYVPVILGSGIPLFPNNPIESNWTLTENIAYASGIIKLSYRLLRY